MASISSLVVAFISSIIVFLFTQDWQSSLVNLIVVFGISFFLFNFLLQRFIYKKIKLIYKNIYRFKTQNPKLRKKLGDGSKDPIAEVSKEVMEWMRENQKEVNLLKEQADFRREFLGNVSHELKTPIQSIQGYVHTLLDGALEDKKVNRVFLKKAGKGVDRLAELVSDLTAISEYESKEIHLVFQNYNIADQVNEVFEMVEQLAKNKKITLGFKKDASKSFVVNADKHRIERVLVNLIVNAIKYGKEDGHVNVGFYDLDKNILIEVSDDGEGIAEEHLPRLFERFYRTDLGRSRELGGSGLGLSIVKHIIESHKQTINVRSEVGKGSTFGFTLRKG
ncbi:MAG: sensor histidine kinase [Bacteroidia bacterium]|nr:sensor histidine kinase [Bacteroidia bacterium]NNJ55538.1 sensor histidine kinase [Bacteroidia bacterium]